MLSSSYSKDEGSEARRRPPQSLGLNPVSRLSARDPSLSEISAIFNLHCDWEKPPPSPPPPSPSPYLGVSLSPAQAAGSSHRWFSLSREKSGLRRSSAACSRSSLRGTDCSTDCRARSSSSGASSRDTSLRSDSAWAAMMPPPARARQSTLPAPGSRRAFPSLARSARRRLPSPSFGWAKTARAAPIELRSCRAARARGLPSLARAGLTRVAGG